jgi:hypothetical protein
MRTFESALQIMRRGVIALLGAAALVLPAGADAATINESGSAVTITSGAESENFYGASDGGATDFVRNAPTAPALSGTGSCSTVSADEVDCPSAAITANLGDGADVVDLGFVTTVTADLRGAAGTDTLTGGSLGDTLDGGTESDTLDGGPGGDTINAIDGAVDTVDCGSGTDVVQADGNDSLSGCESITLQDSDGDGVPDSSDLCPTQAAATANGCPATADPDADGDGVPDSSDLCPTQAAATANGCPTGGENTSCQDAKANLAKAKAKLKKANHALADAKGDAARERAHEKVRKARKRVRAAKSDVQHFCNSG